MGVSEFDRAAVNEASDEEILGRVLAGEAEMFEIFVRRHSRRVYRVALSVLRDPIDSEDVVQDTFVSAFKHLHQFARRAAFATWLTRIALHTALHRRKLRSREICVENLPESSLRAAPGRSMNPEHLVSAEERGRMLQEAIAVLPENYRAVVVLRDMDELDTRVVGGLLGISRENVKVRLHRAHRLLRKRLAGRAFGHFPRIEIGVPAAELQVRLTRS